MAIFHLFNPEHDLALAYGKEGFTPPAAARNLRKGLGFLPAFWADEGDWVVVDDVEEAERQASRFATLLPKVNFCHWKQLGQIARGTDGKPLIDPWGWNHSLRHALLRAGLDEGALPSREQLEWVRAISHRRTTINLLETLVRSVPATIGKRKEAKDLDEVWRWMEQWGRCVVKAPWSSSGRGVRLVDNDGDPGTLKFVRNTIERQGSIIVEPFYNKVMDFAMEFILDGEKEAKFVGLSVFHTNRGAYLGNVLAGEDEKWDMLQRVAGRDDMRSLAKALQRLLGEMCDPYRGPVGVDMMVVEQEGGRCVHPCVEVNVRRTMGMAAVSVAMRTEGRFKTMATDCRGGECQLVLT